jgi:amino acid transporter
MQKRPQLILPAVALGVLLLIVGAIYWIDDAGSLPSFFPGHQAGSTHVHFKHGLAAVILGLGCFVFAWFQTGEPGPKPASPSDRGRRRPPT